MYNIEFRLQHAEPNPFYFLVYEKNCRNIKMAILCHPPRDVYVIPASNPLRLPFLAAAGELPICYFGKKYHKLKNKKDSAWRVVAIILYLFFYSILLKG